MNRRTGKATLTAALSLAREREKTNVQRLRSIVQQKERIRRVRYLACAFLFALLTVVANPVGAAPTTSVVLNPWSQMRQPSTHRTEIRGSYAGGCLHGAQSTLNDQGDFFLMRTSRRRYYAHPDMRTFIKDFSRQIKTNNLGTLLVGDIGQPRGGPTLKGHASHQTGLDADIWFWLDAPIGTGKFSQPERERLSALSMLNGKRNGINRQRFGTRQIATLKLAAKHAHVQRIFVNPYIKKELCQVTRKAAWLNKIRPWWGHHYHFHVRLACPADESQCRAQATVPQGAGCGKALAWWFSKEAADTLRESMEKSRKKTDAQRLADKLAKLPGNCADVLNTP